MATFNKFESFSEYLCEGVFNFNAANDTLNIYLSNAAPNAATHTVKATGPAEISTGNGYTGPQDTQNDLSRTGGTTSVTGVDVTINATGTVATFQYVILYDDTPAATPTDPLIGWWDYGSGVVLNNGDSFTVNFGASMFTVA